VAEGVAAADVAETHRKAAQANEDQFELDGELRQLFDAYNALAATAFGGLKTIVHDKPELKLGGEWAESFFLHESRPQVVMTVAQATADVKRLEDELAAAQQRLVELKAKQAAAEAAEAAEAAAQAAVAAAKKETAAAKQKEKDAIEAAKKAKKARS
jgi:DNA repair exonuclease SbcCD ATPase subunit